MTQLRLIKNAQQYSDKIAIIDEKSSFSYQQLIQDSQKTASFLIQKNPNLLDKCIAFLAVPNYHYSVIQWGIWQAGGIAVPISPHHPLAEVEYILQDSQADFLLLPQEKIEYYQPLCQELNITPFSFEETLESAIDPLPEVETSQKAFMIYTSGTTGKPKGVITTHQIIEAQIQTLVEAWQWTSEDSILHLLPLHHIHGVINILNCALWSGATVEFLPKFDATVVWQKFVERDFTIFMAVPTIYQKLLNTFGKLPASQQRKLNKKLKAFRLMVSGSAALPVSLLEKWRSISRQTLLERYGMTEIGMALSNPYEGERKAGTVGKALPNVEIRLVNEEGTVVENSSESGEIQVKGPAVFQEYWNLPEITEKSFQEGWFKTGDIAERDEDGYYRILGRNSVDIIKTGGYKVSALEIENVLLSHPFIEACAVVGIPDEEWGEIVATALILSDTEPLSQKELKDWVQDKLASYKIPTQMLVLKDIPRNAMGKVNKPVLKELFEKVKALK